MALILKAQSYSAPPPSVVKAPVQSWHLSFKHSTLCKRSEPVSNTLLINGHIFSVTLITPFLKYWPLLPVARSYRRSAARTGPRLTDTCTVISSLACAAALCVPPSAKMDFKRILTEMINDVKKKLIVLVNDRR